MHYATVKGILSPKNGMNLYRGCQHGCIYCDSRSDCYQMDHDFTDVEVKENAIPLLEDALGRRRKPCMLGMGAMTDPYIPLEETLGHTRQALECILRHGFGVTLITKSDRVLRDLPLLAQINAQSKCVVQMTLDRFFHHPLLFHRPRKHAARQFVAVRKQRRPRRSCPTRHRPCRP